MGQFAPLLITGAAQVGGAIAESEAIKAEAAYRRRIAEANAAESTLAAEDVITRGQEAVFIQRAETKQRIAEQRAAAAGSGVVVDEGSIAEIVRGTQALGEANIMTLRTNAFRQAHGFRVEALESSTRARFTKIAARSARRTTLLTGGLQAARGILAAAPSGSGAARAR